MLGINTEQDTESDKGSSLKAVLSAVWYYLLSTHLALDLSVCASTWYMMALTTI